MNRRGFLLGALASPIIASTPLIMTATRRLLCPVQMVRFTYPVFKEYGTVCDYGCDIPLQNAYNPEGRITWEAGNLPIDEFRANHGEPRPHAIYTDWRRA